MVHGIKQIRQQKYSFPHDEAKVVRNKPSRALFSLKNSSVGERPAPFFFRPPRAPRTSCPADNWKQIPRDCFPFLLKITTFDRN